MRTLAFLTGILAGAIATETIHRYGGAILWHILTTDVRPRRRTMACCTLCGEKKIPGVVCCDEISNAVDEMTCRYCDRTYESEAAVRACERICARNRDDHPDH